MISAFFDIVAGEGKGRRMVGREELVQAFGPDGTVAMDYKEALGIGLSEVDALIVSHVGLPRHVGPTFTTEIVGSPPLFAVRNFSDDGANKALILGGPSDDERMRYFLNVRDGFVGLVAFYEEPQGEIVNSTLSDFVEFVYRIGIRDLTPEPESASARRAETEELASLLVERDPFAFAEPDNWWSMVIAQIRESAEHRP